MSTRTLPVTAGSFERVFAAVATKGTHMRRQRNTLTDWREIAWEALRRKKLGDTLWRAIETLSIKYREVLFLQDVKNLTTAETAWVLNITVGVVKYRLLRARMRVRDALTNVASLAETQSEKLRPCQFRHARDSLRFSDLHPAESGLSCVEKNYV